MRRIISLHRSMNLESSSPATAPALRHVPVLRGAQVVRMAYWEWAAAEAQAGARRTVVCVHGLSRQGRDFDVLAADLAAQGCRVVCPDVMGRGRSDRLADPMGYNVPAYVADMVALLARLDVDEVDWVGTSMGGLIGLGVASLQGPGAGPERPLVRRLVLNDVGPTIEPASIERIRTYLGEPAHFETLDAAADALWAVSRGFGPHSREQWLALTRPMLVPHDQGGFQLHYDPAIAVPFGAVTPEIAKAGEAMLWAAYDRLTMPVLLLRGAESDLLSPTTARAMTERGPRARLREFAGVGHAPMLVQPEQRAAVRDFLLGG
jgi:pimeloyl-ACP methyl ester carboxylesterase